MRTLIAAIALTPILCLSYAMAQTAVPTHTQSREPSAAASARDGPGEAPSHPESFSRAFTGTFNGVKLTYSATAAETYLKNDKGEEVLSIFSVAYVRRDVTDERTRPVTFVFNGGPGTASLWLHIGFLG